ncbi:ELWxxDGT repeat protein [Microcystis viridis]|uniref:ELWxxDGT repeat protein n=1 Tax=Microcystis viridis TaxID=44822 RepID=UPI001E350FFD|nr:ELWxxDGT repeat protein [Microcystis viridis]
MEKRRHGGRYGSGQGYRPRFLLVCPPQSNGSGQYSTLYFTANDNVNGQELWKSDGTEAGTVLVKNINPGSGFSGNYPRNLTAVGKLRRI